MSPAAESHPLVAKVTWAVLDAFDWLTCGRLATFLDRHDATLARWQHKLENHLVKIRNQKENK